MAPAPVVTDAPPPQAPTASPTPVPTPAADGHSAWFHALAAVGNDKVGGPFWGDALTSALHTLDSTFSADAVLAVH